MLNILIPLAGKSRFFDDAELAFPKPLIEVSGLPMVEYAVWYLNNIKVEKRFIFIIGKDDASKYYLDRTLKLLTNESTQVVIQEGTAEGAPCSALMAIDLINNDNQLIISNGDQLLLEDLNRTLSIFEQKNADGGVVTFESVHPQWSYVYCDSENRVWETAEKKPISKRAVAGFYYFKKGSDFVEATQKMIEKENRVAGLFYTSLVFNELILEGKKIYAHATQNEKYHSFYSRAKIKEFEKTHHFKSLGHFKERLNNPL